MVKDHLNRKKGNLLPPIHGLLFLISSKGLLYAPSHRQVAQADIPVMEHWREQEIVQWVHHKESV